MNDDVLLEIISRCPSTEISKFRLLNQSSNKRTYESCFINNHLRRTNSVLGYFIQDYKKYRPRFVSSVEEEEEAPEKTRISLDFLPSKDVKIEACDTNHGILLCVDDKFKGGKRIPDYIVCKPATKQYRIIPNPKTRYFTVATGLMAIQSNPFRYKIVRVSQPLPWERRKMKDGFFNLNCEVFDSDSFTWERLNDLELPDECFIRSDQPVSAYGCLHWLTRKKNVIRFCVQTKTWSLIPVPEDVLDVSGYIELVSYEGKLGVMCSTSRQGFALWVLDNSLGKLWTNVKGLEITGLDDRYAKPLWFPSNDVVSVAGFCRLGLYNLNNKKSRYWRMSSQNCLPSYLSKDVCFPFYSNYEIVCLNEDRVVKSNGCKRSDKE